MDNDIIHIGVIGAGRMGRMHAANLATRVPGAAVRSVADVNLEAAADLAHCLGAPVHTADYGQLLADPALDAVIICTPVATHAPLIRAAARAGKHAFCEKPVGTDLAEIDQALAAARAAGTTVQIGFNRRFDASFIALRAAVAAGAVGTPHLLRIASRDPRRPALSYVRESGGLFLDMTIHDFDMARFVVGDEVTEVYAAGAVLVDPGIGAVGDIDTALVTLRFAGGALGVIDNSREAVYGYDQRVEVFGSGGMVRAENPIAEATVHLDAAGARSALPAPDLFERYAESFVAEMRAFVECVRTGAPAPVSGEDGRAAVLLARAAQTSYDQRRPVSLAEVDSQSPIVVTG